MKRKILSLVMALVMLAGLVCTAAVPALANDGGGDTEYYNGTVGSNVNWQINMRTGYDVKKVTSISGVLPDGTRTKVRNGALYVTGTPTTAGTFKANIHVRASLNGHTWDDQLPCVFTIEGGSRSDYSLDTYYKTMKVGEYQKLTFDMDSSGYITDHRIYGEIPNGMSVSMDRYGLYLKGTPADAGTYTFTLRVTNSRYNCHVSQPVSITVKGATIPTVTKSPTSETVEEGGRALFVARANDANSITWYVSKNGITYLASEAPYYFTGLTVSGTSGETLALNNVPVEMDGWMVQAKFNGSAGSVYSGQARVNVTAQYVAPPTINQPENIIMEPGERATISVKATTPANNGIAYQWYEYAQNASGKYEAVWLEGEEDSALTLDYVEGDRYFYCEVWCYTNRNTSKPVQTEFITVTGNAPAPTEPAPTEPPATKPTEPAETTPAPTAPVETVPVQTAATESVQPTQPAQPAPQRQTQDHTVAFIIGGVLMVAMICCTAVLITVLNKGKYSKK